MNLRKTISGAAVLLSLLGVAKADNVEVAILIDASGSISDVNYNLQKNAYASVAGSVIPTDGTAYVGVWQFARNVQQVFAPQLISDAADLASLITAFQNMNRGAIDTSATAIGDAINIAAAALAGATPFPSDFRQVIDVSTDGQSNTGANVHTAADNAILVSGMNAVNALGVDTGVDLSWVPSDISPSFAIFANGFGDFEDALNRKVIKEVNGIPDGGATILMLLGAFIGLGGARRFCSR